MNKKKKKEKKDQCVYSNSYYHLKEEKETPAVQGILTYVVHSGVSSTHV